MAENQKGGQSSEQVMNRLSDKEKMKLDRDGKLDHLKGLGSSTCPESPEVDRVLREIFYGIDGFTDPRVQFETLIDKGLSFYEAACEVELLEDDGQVFVMEPVEEGEDLLELTLLPVDDLPFHSLEDGDDVVVIVDVLNFISIAKEDDGRESLYTEYKRFLPDHVRNIMFSVLDRREELLETGQKAYKEALAEAHATIRELVDGEDFLLELGLIDTAYEEEHAEDCRCVKCELEALVDSKLTPHEAALQIELEGREGVDPTADYGNPFVINMGVEEVSIDISPISFVQMAQQENGRVLLEAAYIETIVKLVKQIMLECHYDRMAARYPLEETDFVLQSLFNTTAVSLGLLNPGEDLVHCPCLECQNKMQGPSSEFSIVTVQNQEVNEEELDMDMDGVFQLILEDGNLCLYIDDACFAEVAKLETGKEELLRELETCFSLPQGKVDDMLEVQEQGDVEYIRAARDLVDEFLDVEPDLLVMGLIDQPTLVAVPGEGDNS